jgi:hypothetical protein
MERLDVLHLLDGAGNQYVDLLSYPLSSVLVICDPKPKVFVLFCLEFCFLFLYVCFSFFLFDLRFFAKPCLDFFSHIFKKKLFMCLLLVFVI